MNAPHDIIAKLHQREGMFHKSEQIVADFILSNLESAVHFNATEIAEKSGVSMATVNRLCKSLGCDGFRDFKILLAQHVAISKQYVRQANGGGEASADTLVNYVCDTIVSSITKIQSQLDPEMLVDAIKIITSSNRIVFLGVGGGSANIAAEGANRFFRLGISSTVEHDSFKQRMIAATLGTDDLVFAISSTGLPKVLLDSVSIAKQYGASTLCLTRPDSPLASACDIAITVDCPEDQDIYKPTVSRYVFLAVLDVIATAVARAKPEKTRETLRRVRSAIFSIHRSTKTQPIGD